MPFKLTSYNPNNTGKIAEILAGIIRNGDVVLLRGDVGAGKTDLTRKIIQTVMREHGKLEDVPSPTFTLVQTYELGTIEYVHADLYRLSHPDEIFELGLDSAFETSACFIEWPDRLGSLAPEHALTIEIAILNDTERTIEFSWQDAKWDSKLAGIESLNLGNNNEQ